MDRPQTQILGLVELEMGCRMKTLFVTRQTQIQTDTNSPCTDIYIHTHTRLVFRSETCGAVLGLRQHFVQVVREGFHIILAPGARAGWLACRSLACFRFVLLFLLFFVFFGLGVLLVSLLCWFVGLLVWLFGCFVGLLVGCLVAWDFAFCWPIFGIAPLFLRGFFGGPFKGVRHMLTTPRNTCGQRHSPGSEPLTTGPFSPFPSLPEAKSQKAVV